MAIETIHKGVGAALHIAAETKAMREFFTMLRNAGLQTIDPLDAHITLVDCAETQIPVYSDRDQLALNRARNRANEYLASIPYYELVFSPASPELEIFGCRAGVEIAEKDELLGLRRYIGDIFKDEANIDLGNRNFVPHMSAGLKTRGIHAAVGRIRRPRIPRRLHVIGHDTSERAFVNGAEPRERQSYRNRPLRAVS